MSHHDKRLLGDLSKGDKKALSLLYETYWKTLFLSSYNLLKNKEQCEEIIQDVFIDLWNKRKELQIKISLKAYLYAWVRYKVFAEFKRKKFENVELFEDLNHRFQHATPETVMMHAELEAQIEAVVEMLPRKCRKVFKLSRNKQLSHKEISEKLSISPKTVENHITYALKFLKSNLGYLIGLDILYPF